MAMIQSLIIASVLVLVMLVNGGSSVRCYECNSYKDKKCEDDIPPSTYIVECKANQRDRPAAFCRKIKQIIEFSVNDCSAIRCYECNSHKDPKCADDIPPDALSMDCGSHKNGAIYTFCRKITQVIEFAVHELQPDSRVIRGCGWDDSNYKNQCYQRAGFGGRQEVCACETDNCNSSVSLKSTLMTLTVGLIAISGYCFRY